jgi:putative GTP pyrophosphokinase
MKMEEHHKETGYRSTHIVIQFSRKRLNLNEYRNFAGLCCELQLTSALYQAWSEVEHDIFYKRELRPDTEARKEISFLRKELEAAMKIHIEQASEILETVAEKMKQLQMKPPQITPAKPKT